MKTRFLMICTALTVMIMSSCRDELLLENNQHNNLKSSLSEKPSVLKLSFIEESVRKTEFPENSAVDLGLTFLEEPKSSRKRIYIEVYEDLTFSKEVLFQESPYNYPADQHQLPDDMPKVKRFLYQNGQTKGYDKDGNLIFEEDGGQVYWMEPSMFESKEAAFDYLYNSYADPKKNSDLIQRKLKESSEYTEYAENILEFTNDVELAPSAINQRGEIDADVVTNEKKYMLKNLGVVYRTEGYTADGTLKDVEHNFYSYSADSILHMTSSHYRNREVLAGYDVTVIEISDIFYSDFKFETTL